MELKGVAGGVRVYDDYAHHPTEVEAQLLAAREVVGAGRLVVAFQPHRYSRTLAFAEGFGRALALADEVVVMEVYAAGEDPVPGASGGHGRGGLPAAARPGRLRAQLVGGARSSWRAAPGPATSC